jgi:TPR repeat protein
LAAIAEHENYSPDQKAAFDSEARSYFAAGSQVCTPQLLAADDGSAQGGAPPDSEMGPDDNSEVTGAPPPEAQAALAQQTKEQLIANYARQLLSLGDAALAQGRNRRARRYWSQAIEVGKAVGAQAAIVAQKRIQTHTLTCHFTDESLKAISRDYKRLSGDLIHMRVIQQALHALGHYDGPNNGVLGIMTRAAIRKFQREMAFDETDTLNPLQTVYLICNAAETTRDLASQNALGIMYAAGLGVEQNIDLALEWLRAASSRGYADSTFNLALLYGSGIVLNSYRLCDIPQSPEQADQYLQEAANQGQPRATYLLQRYGPRSSAKDVRERWKLIETEQLAQNDKDGIYAKRLATIGAKCDPDRATR